jgi:hypothetical protein
MGVVEGADQCVAMCCGKDVCAAAVNGPAGGRIVVRPLQPLPFDLIQEWHIARTPYECLDPVVADEPIVHAVTDSTREFVVGVTEAHLFTVDLPSRCMETIAELPGKASLVCGPSGAVYGLDDNAALWRFDMANRKVERAAVALPDGVWESVRVVWARDPHTGVLYTADAQGCLFRFDEGKGFSGPLTTVPHTPVHCMAATNDGRLFGFAGDGMARLFRFDPGTADMADCGVAVSVFERRRYGYSFADAVRGRDGELIFGENDDLGHLWLYFPRIEPADSHGHHRERSQ